MIDIDLIEKKLAFIETCVSDLKRLSKPQDIETDLKEERFVVHTLQIAIQAALDVASHIVSDERLGEPATNAELFDILRLKKGLEPELTEKMIAVVGFRNIVVHGYQKLDKAIVRDVVVNRLDDLLHFVVAIREL